MINNHNDRENRPLVYGLTAKEKERMLERYEERALDRKRDDDMRHAALLKLGQALKQGRLE